MYESENSVEWLALSVLFAPANTREKRGQI